MLAWLQGLQRHEQHHSYTLGLISIGQKGPATFHGSRAAGHPLEADGLLEESLRP